MNYCGAKTRSGTPCKRRPCKNGRCNLHGGKSLRGVESATYKHGRYIRQLNEQLRARLTETETEDPLDLADELGIQRVVFADYLSRFVPGVPLTALDITYINNWANDIGRTAERINKIRNESALTDAELKFLKVRILDVVTRYITDPQQQTRFIAELFGLDEHGSRTPELIEGTARGAT